MALRRRVFGDAQGTQIASSAKTIKLSDKLPLKYRKIEAVNADFII